MTGFTQVWTPLDFEADGKQCDWLRVPHSTDLSGYGVVPIPIVCIEDGCRSHGPSLMAGSHGDEYEGQVALAALAREIDPADVRGRIIILPALNAPAVEAGRRVSPLDAGNLNRSFPGDPVGGPTAMIAHYVTTVLLAMADLAIDLHAGGRSMPLPAMRPDQERGNREGATELADLAIAFGAPVTSVSDGSGGGGRTTFGRGARPWGGCPHSGTGWPRYLVAGRACHRRTGTASGPERFGILPGVKTDTASPTRFMRVWGREASSMLCARLFGPGG